ncbi:unnamed protein product [Camellia sinensis]
MVVEREEVDYSVFIDCTPLYDDIEWDPILVALQGGGPLPNSDPVLVAPPQNALASDPPLLALQGGGSHPDSDPVVVAPPQDALAVNPVQVDQTPNGGDVDLEITDLPVVDAFNPEQVMDVEVPKAEVMEIEVEVAEAEVIEVEEAEVEVMVVEVAAEDENPRQLRRRGRPRKIPSAAEITMPEISARQLRVRPSRVRPQTNPNALRRVVHRTNRDEDFKLPSGWIEVRIARKSGASVGHVDRYFIEKKTGEKCRSRAEVTTYLATQAQRKKLQAQPRRNGVVVIQG